MELLEKKWLRKSYCLCEREEDGFHCNYGIIPNNIKKREEKMIHLFKKRRIEVLTFETLKEATLKALNDKSDEVILYSPMFASYDQYKSYEERGKEFNRIILSYYSKK